IQPPPVVILLLNDDGLLAIQPLLINRLDHL
ncbi:hypothetical protein A2U01_0100595, partial [Trifolium medium]|nr:hypothetical protein [Trifolium medium]